MITALKIILIPLVHSLISILGVGLALLLLLQEKLNLQNSSPVGRILLSAALGILYNSLQFILIVLAHHYRLLPQPELAALKYGFDLLFLVAISIKYGKKITEEISLGVTAVLKRDNLLIFLFSIGIGVTAILNFPHVFDSGQLMETCSMATTGWDFMNATRFGIGFSALGYFPSVLVNDLPLCSLFSGFKLLLSVVTGLTVIYGIDRLHVAHPAGAKLLYYALVQGSLFGLYGVVELGKDSIWALLFGFNCIFSLFRIDERESIAISAIFFSSSLLLGMIAIPYVLFFTGLYFICRFLPNRVSASKPLYMATVVFLFLAGTRLMPVKLAINKSDYPAKAGDAVYSYYAPTNGRTTFYSYLSRHKMSNRLISEPKIVYKNIEWLVIIGLMGVLFLPFFKDRCGRDRFNDAGLKSAALFLLAAPVSFLLLTLPAKGWLPASRFDKIPFTPITTFDAWNLIKDVPQWCIQVLAGIFFILLLESLVIKLVPDPRRQRFAYSAAVGVLLFLIAATQFPVIKNYRYPAEFNRYGGNKNPHFLRIMGALYNHPGIKKVHIVQNATSINYNSMYWDLQHYFPGFKSNEIPPLSQTVASELQNDLPFILVAQQDYAHELSALMKKPKNLKMHPLFENEQRREGVYLFFRKANK